MINPSAEPKSGLWMLVVSPSVWAAHFMASYLTAAIWCAKFGGEDKSAWVIRVAMLIYTIIALAIILMMARLGYRQAHARGIGQGPHADDTPEDRSGFLGFATLLLSILSAVATLFVALVALFVRSCQ